MSEPKSPVEQALELLLYAPVGLALTAAEELPKLVEKGRQRVNGQITMARMIGQFAVAEGQKRGEAIIKDATDRLSGTGSRPAPAPATAPAPASPPPRPTPAPPSVPVVQTEPDPAVVQAAVSEVVATESPSTNGSSRTKATDLAIPGYDALSASQVVQRLAGLADDELEAVREDETAHRGRKTILGRISQLQLGA